MKNDHQFREATLSKVTAVEDDRFEVEMTDGWVLQVANLEHLPLPKVGETIRTYGRGVGYTIRGVSVGKKVYFYRTEAEDDEEHKKQVAKDHAKKREDFKKGLEKWNKDLKNLDPIFQERINFFMRNKDWAAQFGPYEMFCCKEASMIIKTFKNEDEVRAFRKMEYSEQRKVCDISDEHSGNTFGCACMLAELWFKDKTLLPKMHGALCPLAGCDA